MLGIFLIFMVVIMLINLFAPFLDEGRIEKYIENHGGRFISINRKYFGPGWSGGNGQRIYKISYSDKDGYTHEAYVRTGSLSGVYFTEDKIVADNKNERIS